MDIFKNYTGILLTQLKWFGIMIGLGVVLIVLAAILAVTVPILSLVAIIAFLVVVCWAIYKMYKELIIKYYNENFKNNHHIIIYMVLVFTFAIIASTMQQTNAQEINLASLQDVSSYFSVKAVITGLIIGAYFTYFVLEVKKIDKFAIVTLINYAITFILTLITSFLTVKLLLNPLLKTILMKNSATLLLIVTLIVVVSLLKNALFVTLQFNVAKMLNKEK